RLRLPRARHRRSVRWPGHVGVQLGRRRADQRQPVGLSLDPVARAFSIRWRRHWILDGALERGTPQYGSSSGGDPSSATPDQRTRRRAHADVGRRGFEHVDADVVALRVRREKEEALSPGRVPVGVAAEDFAVLEADGDLDAAGRRARQLEEPLQVAPLGVAPQILDEEDRLEVLEEDFDRGASTLRKDLKDRTVDREFESGPLQHLAVEEMGDDPEVFGHGRPRTYV